MTMWKSGLRNHQRHSESRSGHSRGRNLGCASQSTNTPDISTNIYCICHVSRCPCFAVADHSDDDEDDGDDDDYDDDYDDLSLVASYVRCTYTAVSNFLKILTF